MIVVRSGDRAVIQRRLIVSEPAAARVEGDRYSGNLRQVAVEYPHIDGSRIQSGDTTSGICQRNVHLSDVQRWIYPDMNRVGEAEARIIRDHFRRVRFA